MEVMLESAARSSPTSQPDQTPQNGLLTAAQIARERTAPSNDEARRAVHLGLRGEVPFANVEGQQVERRPGRDRPLEVRAEDGVVVPLWLNLLQGTVADEEEQSEVRHDQE